MQACLGMNILIPFIFFFCQATWATSIWLRIGESRSLAASPDAVIRIGTRNIIRVIEDGAKVRIIGLKPGMTSLVVDRASYLVHVARSSDKEFFQRLKDEVSRMKGLRLVSDVQPFEIHGTLLRFRDWRRLAELAREYQGDYVFKARALSDAGEAALKELKKIAAEAGFPVLGFTSSPNFTVRVPKGAKAILQSATELYSPYGIRVESVESQLLVQPLVRTRVVLAELSRTHSRTYGIEWPSAYQARLVPRLSGQDDLMLTLKALEAEGQAQILASPTLVCRSGGEAKFHAGGEFPIRIVSRATRDVIWKQHGVVLNVRPKADFAGALSIEIETEVSLLDMAHAVDGIPALKSNKVKSHFDLQGKQTIALSGLIKQELGRSSEGLPGLSSLPVLGPLFSSRQFRAQQSELIVFVTPEVQSPGEDAPLQMPEGWITHEW